MSGIILLFAGATAFFVNFIVANVALHYQLTNFARKSSALYATACIIYFFVLCRASRQPRRDSTDILAKYAIFVGLLCSLVGFITPFFIQWFIQELLQIDDRIAKMLS